MSTATEVEGGISEFSEICSEAIDLYGHDISALRAFVESRISLLPEKKKQQIEFALSQVFNADGLNLTGTN